VASLSRGPVTPADKIGYFNRTLIMRACMDDGTLLTPDRPALALDSTLLRRALFGVGESQARAAQDAGPNGEVWSTASTVGGAVYRHVLVPLLREAYALRPSELAANDGLAQPANGQLIFDNAFRYAEVPVATFSDDEPLKMVACDRTDFKLYHTVPLLGNGWGLVGETSKWVPVSPVRVRSVATSSSGAPVTLQLAGVAGESITFRFVSTGAGEPVVHAVNCVFGATATLTMTPGGCTDSQH